jgi:transcription initiation factor IIE alpha subunit
MSHTNSQIRALENEASSAGDALQVLICKVAVGDTFTDRELTEDFCLDATERKELLSYTRETARAECERVIGAAAAMEEV